MTLIFSILFWTPQKEEKELIESYTKQKNIMLMGDYGTGKTVVIQSVAEKLLNSGRQLVYINALDWPDMSLKEKHYKTWEDVLDVITKLRFEDSGVTVLDVGTMRKQYIERNIGEVVVVVVW